MTRTLTKKALAAVGATALGAATLMAAAPAQADASSVYGVAATGNISALGMTFAFQGGKITGDTGAGAGEIDVYQAQFGQVALDVSAATIAAGSIQATVTAEDKAVAVNLSGSNYVYSGSITLMGFPATVTNLTLVPPTPGPGPSPTPGPVPSGKARQAQLCAALPSTVKKRGVTVIRGRFCKTNAGERVRVEVLGSQDGKVMNARKAKRYFSMWMNRRGRVFVRTYGKTFNIHLLERAHETATYNALFDATNAHL